MDVASAARKHALKNASDYGKASAGAVAGKVIAEVPEAKKGMADAMKQIAQTVAEVNKLSKAQVQAELANYEFAEKKPEERRIRLQEAQEGKVVTRFLPEPNGYLHIGHAKAAWLSRQAADDYSGKCTIRFDDTNPESERQEYVDAISEDAEWLGLKFDGKSFTSDLMPELYRIAERFIRDSSAYVCTCSVEEVRKNRELAKACKCRDNPAEANLAGWEKMQSGGHAEGEAIVRLRGDMASLNTVMRDPTLFRIIEAPHYRQGKKYRAWPTYDFEAAISDSLCGVTHALRSKEYELRDELYYKIIELSGLKLKPVVYSFARLSIKNTLLSKRFLKPLIEGGKVSGWDDPRLPTIRGLRRRGLQPEAIKHFVLASGLSKVESEPGWDALLSENRKLLDPVCEHYYFVADPIELEVKNVPDEHYGKTRLPKLPGKPDAGDRIAQVGSKFFISGDDARALKKGDNFRLKGLYNVKVTEKAGGKLAGEFAGTELLEGAKLQWVSGEKGEHVAATIVMPGDLLDENGEFNEKSMGKLEGLCEKDCAKLAQGAIIQFERVGFARLDDSNKLTFTYSC